MNVSIFGILKVGTFGIQNVETFRYGVATVSRIDKIIGLLCKRDL